MNLGNLVATRGARKKRKRLGRGEGSGHGGTSTKGHKGQKARTGGYHKRGFEGGQMPLTRRSPKHGFVNPFTLEIEIVNVGDFNHLKAGTVIDESFLTTQGFVKTRQSTDGIKVLGNGELKVPLIFKLSRFSESAKSKILAAGGKIEGI
ncbi:MAG: 50S ribosomal protein L15 [Deltaproteobacteria bacterium]|nr:50S ribosomal protein L15 [Deltaproteobacteria bacterium]